MENSEEKVLELLGKILENAKEVAQLDNDLGSLTLYMFKQVFDLYECKNSENKDYNVSNFIKFVEMYLDRKITNDTSCNNEKYEVDNSVADFILNNSEIDKGKLDEYTDFINKTGKKLQDLMSE